MFYHQAFKKARKEKRIKLLKLAEQLGKSRKTLWSWETGKNSPSIADIRLLSAHLGIKVEDISDIQPLPETKPPENREPDISFNTLGLPAETTSRINDLKTNYIKYKAANTSLKGELNKLNTLLHGLPHIIYSKDTKLKYTYVNDSFISLTQGFNRKALRGSTSSDIFGDKDYAALLAMEQQVIQTKVGIIDEEITIPGTARQRTGIVTIVPILDDNEVLTEINCYIRDITHSRTFDSIRKELDFAISRINHSIWIGEIINGNDDSFKYIYISDNLFNIYGINKTAAFNDPKLWMSVVFNEDMEQLKVWLALTEFPKKLQYRINHPSKGIRWICSEIFREGRDKYFGVVSDITDVKDNEREREIILRTLNNSSDAIRIAKYIDGHNEYVYMNRANKTIYETPIGVLKNNADMWKEFIHPDDKEIVCKSEENVGSRRFCYRLLLQNGRIKRIEERTFRETIDGILYSGTIKRDVTDTYKENTTLMAVIEAFEETMVPVWIVDMSSGEYVYNSKARLKLYEISEDVIRKDKFFWKAYVHPDDLARVESNSEKKGVRKYSQKFRLVMPDGRIKYIHEKIFSRNINGTIFLLGIQQELKENEYQA